PFVRKDHSSSTNVTFMWTRDSLSLFLSTLACMRVTARPVMPRKVLAARFSPSCTAPSKDSVEDATISLIRATAMLSLLRAGADQRLRVNVTRGRVRVQLRLEGVR